VPKSTLICLWWLKNQNFKLLFDNLSLKLKIGIIKILIYMAIKVNTTEIFLRIKSTEIHLDSKVFHASLFLLSKLNIISILNNNDDWNEKDEYIIKYSDKENGLRTVYDDCWINLPNKKILKLIKFTANDKESTFEAINKYLFMNKGLKKDAKKIKPIVYDENYFEGNIEDTWLEILIRFDLIEFLNVKHMDIYYKFQ